MDWVIATLKESEIDRLVTPWACVRKSTLLWAVPTQVSAVRADIATKPVNVMGYEEPIGLLVAEVVEPFETLVVKARTKITFTTGCLCCSTLVMDSKDGTLPPGLVVTDAYTVLKWGSKTVPIMLCNTTGSPINKKRAEGCLSKSHKWSALTSFETGNTGVLEGIWESETYP